jgi:hypothetical protein
MLLIFEPQLRIFESCHKESQHTRRHYVSPLLNFRLISTGFMEEQAGVGLTDEVFLKHIEIQGVT